MGERLNKTFLSVRSLLARSVSKIVPPHEIEDIVQETYVRICQVEKPDNIQHMESFMLKTARNLALDSLKRAEKRLGDSLDDQTEAELPKTRADEPFSQLSSDQEFLKFCESVRHLPVQCRKVFVLRKVYGFSQKEIAERLGISQSTVEKHIASGMKRCVQHMSQSKRPSSRPVQGVQQ